jgi:hypothetical protein
MSHDKFCDVVEAEYSDGLCRCHIISKIRADEREKARIRVNRAAMEIALHGVNRYETADFLDLIDAAVRGDGEQE